MAGPTELLDLSSAIIDAWSAPGGPAPDAVDGPTNRVSNQLTAIDDGLGFVESFSNVVAFRTDSGLVLFDASSVFTGKGCVQALRGWTDDPIDTLVYTHGHVDHVGGSGHFVRDGEGRGHAPPTVVGHDAVRARFDRYRTTNGWNLAINQRQFGPGFGGGVTRADGTTVPFLPDDTAECDLTYEESLDLHVGGLHVVLHHDKGETDDHTWAWIPSHKAVAVGDFVLWVFPNAGNPQKVQRYPLEWAHALRKMMALHPELLLPAHGLAISGKERVATVLGDMADALEKLVDDVVGAMNAGATLDEIVHSVAVDPEVLQKPWMRPIYDEPEFVVRNVWRLYGGWWDGDPAHLKPPPTAALAAELVDLVGGVDALAERAETCSEVGDHRLACQLIELAARASDDPGIWRLRSRLYLARAETETSLMAKGVFTEAARSGDAKADDLDP